MVCTCIRTASKHPSHFLLRPRHDDRCCSTTHAPEAARLSASPFRPRPRREESSRWSCAPATTTPRSCARTWREARTRSRWRAATGRRRWWPRSPRSTRCHMPACRLGRATTSHATSASIPTMSWGAGRLCRRGRAGRRPRRRERQVFVNNVSLGIYGEAVQRPGYRNASCARSWRRFSGHRPSTPDAELRWTDPDGGRKRATRLAGSNDPYRLVERIGSPGRARLDGGARHPRARGATGAPGAVRSPPMWRASAPSFVESGAQRLQRASTARPPNSRCPALPGEARRAESPHRPRSSRSGGACDRARPMTPRWLLEAARVDEAVYDSSRRRRHRAWTRECDAHPGGQLLAAVVRLRGGSRCDARCVRPPRRRRASRPSRSPRLRRIF